MQHEDKAVGFAITQCVVEPNTNRLSGFSPATHDHQIDAFVRCAFKMSDEFQNEIARRAPPAFFLHRQAARLERGLPFGLT